jgi:hypothetical protein
MPIDFAAIAERFAAAFAAQLRAATAAQRGFAPALEKRRTAGRDIELATKDFPIVRFYNGAVSLWLEPGQRAVLTAAPPPPSFGEQLARGGLGFLKGLGLAVEPFRSDSQETAIPRLLSAVDKAVAEVEASVMRFARPKKTMFNPDERTASDLFGLAALAFRALSEASRTGGEIERLVKQLRGTMHVLGITPKDEIPPPLTLSAARRRAAAEAPDPIARSLPDQLDAAAYQLIGAVVIVGALPQMITILLEGMSIRIRMVLLDEFTAIERMVYDLRGDFFEAMFAGIVGLADRGVRLVLGGYQVIAANVTFQLKLWRAFGTELTLGIRDFIIFFADYLRDWMRFLGALTGLFDVLVNFDLTELLRKKIGFLVGGIPAFSLGDLLDRPGLRVNLGLRDTLLKVIDAAELAVPPIVDVFTDYPDRQFERARWLVNELFPGPSLPPGILGTTYAGAPLIPQLVEAAPLTFHSDFPDVSTTLFGGGRKERLIGVVNRLEGAVRGGVRGALNETGKGLDGLATEFSKGAARAADVRAGGKLARIGPQSTELAERVFGPEVTREREARRPEDQLARAFESWLAAGGFFTIGAVIDGYVAGLATHWREQVAEGTELTAPITATSPHILRRRATVGKVVLPRLTLRAARGRVLDEELADAVAAYFATAVRDAYAAGRQRLRELAGAGGR